MFIFILFLFVALKNILPRHMGSHTPSSEYLSLFQRMDIIVAEDSPPQSLQYIYPHGVLAGVEVLC